MTKKCSISELHHMVRLQCGTQGIIINHPEAGTGTEYRAVGKTDLNRIPVLEQS